MQPEDTSKARLDAIMNGLAQTPQRWEYRTVVGILPDSVEQLEGMVKDLETHLTGLGQEGWEIASMDWHVRAEDKQVCIVILRRGSWHPGHIVASTNITQEFVIHKLDAVGAALNAIADHVNAIRANLYD